MFIELTSHVEGDAFGLDPGPIWIRSSAISAVGEFGHYRYVIVDGTVSKVRETTHEIFTLIQFAEKGALTAPIVVAKQDVGLDGARETH